MQTPPTKRLSAQIAQGGCALAPGVFDGCSARVAAAAGASVLHASGGAIARAIGYADIGLVTMTEMLGRVREITEATDAPVIADADTGYGNALNAARAARAFADAGVAALHVEDQTFPKRCGHMAGVELIEPAEMVEKIAAMKAALGGRALLIARTDAVGVEGLGPALARMRAYLAAGGDIAFVEGIETEEMARQVAQAITAPLLINQARASSGDVIAPARLAELGYRIAIYPGDMQRAAMFAMRRVVEAALASGTTEQAAPMMLSNAERDTFFEPG